MSLHSAWHPNNLGSLNKQTEPCTRTLQQPCPFTSQDGEQAEIKDDGRWKLYQKELKEPFDSWHMNPHPTISYAKAPQKQTAAPDTDSANSWLLPHALHCVIYCNPCSHLGPNGDQRRWKQVDVVTWQGDILSLQSRKLLWSFYKRCEGGLNSREIQVWQRT